MQIADLQDDEALRERGIRLVSVTTDPPDVLAAAAKPLRHHEPAVERPLAPDVGNYEMLGKGGMGHAEANGHAFMLLDADGRIAWQQAFAEMYVPPADLLEALPAAD